VTATFPNDGGTLSVSHALYDWFIAHSIKINGKMARALYEGLMESTRGFGDDRCTGETFAMSGLDVNHAQCTCALSHRHSLAFLRMKYSKRS
jgi:hypothetical protein